jgi:hypothetical protein
MKKNIVIILIVLGIFLSAGFMLARSSVFSVRELPAATIQGLQKQIKALQQQVKDLMSRLYSMLQAEKEIPEQDLSQDTIPPILSNLEPEHVTSDSAIITWGTNELSDSAVIYSAKYMRKGVTSGTLTAINLVQTTHHEVKLTSLKPNTKYYYYVSSTDPSGNTSISNVHSITTLPGSF